MSMFIALAALHGLVLAASPTVPVIAIGIWWTSNTIAHNFIHRPFFRTRTLNLLFSSYLSILIGIPQALWRDRHLAHHAGGEWRLCVSGQLLAEVSLVGGLWTLLSVLNPLFFLTSYLPGYVIGLALCAVQGHYEHADGTTSHYGAIYNALCFNDGYHAEHHAQPGVHWTRLTSGRVITARVSRWPALFRWLERLNLETLEKVVLSSRLLQRLVIGSHRRAFAALIPQLPPIRRVAIVGGGLFPRTALIFRDLVPNAQLVIVDVSAANLDVARSFLGGDVTFLHERYSARPSPAFDLVVIPLSFQGDRQALYRHPPSNAVIVHDWIWRKRGESRVVSVGLLKRLNLVRR